MRVRHYLLSIMAMTLSLVAVACGENKEVPHESEGNITLSAEILTVSYEKQTQNITVDADGEWGVYPQIDWVKAQPSGGVKGTTTLKLTIEENKTGDVREGVLEFRRKGKTIELRVKQNYDIEAVAIADENFLAALVERYDQKFFIQTATRSYEYQDSGKSYIGFRCVQSYLGRVRGDNPKTSSNVYRNN